MGSTRGLSLLVSVRLIMTGDVAWYSPVDDDSFSSTTTLVGAESQAAMVPAPKKAAPARAAADAVHDCLLASLLDAPAAAAGVTSRRREVKFLVAGDAYGAFFIVQYNTSEKIYMQ